MLAIGIGGPETGQQQFAKQRKVILAGITCRYYHFLTGVRILSMETVLRTRIIFMRLRHRVKILMQLRLLPYFIGTKPKFLKVTKVSKRSDILFFRFRVKKIGLNTGTQ
jgi:hypothetical protein